MTPVLACQILPIFTGIALEDLSYSNISQEIILTIYNRFVVHQLEPNPEIFTQYESLVKQILEALLDLEPLTRAQA